MEQLPLGCVAGGCHGVVLSLPTLRDLLGYETGERRVTRAITHGYPRFVAHTNVRRLIYALAGRLAATDDVLVCAVTSESIGARLADYARCRGGCGRQSTATVGSAAVARVIRGADLSTMPGGDEGIRETAGAASPGLARLAIVTLSRCACAEAAAKAFQQHTGARVCSRQAADALAELGLGSEASVAAAANVPCAIGSDVDEFGCDEGDDDDGAAALDDAAAATAVADLQHALATLLRAPVTDVRLASCGAAAMSAAHSLIGRVWAASSLTAASSSAAAAGAPSAGQVDTVVVAVEPSAVAAATANHGGGGNAGGLEDGVAPHIRPLGPPQAAGGVRKGLTGNPFLPLHTLDGDAGGLSGCGGRRLHLRPRTVWVQLGWLYVDTTELLRRIPPDLGVGGGSVGGAECGDNAVGDESAAAEDVAAAVAAAVAECGGNDWCRAAPLSPTAVALYDVCDTALLAAMLRQLGPAAAGVITECPTNPLVHTAPAPALRAVTSAAGVPLVIDSTMAGPGTLRLLPHCDLLVASTTKFVGSRGDVMGGVLVVGSGGGAESDGGGWATALRRQLQLDQGVVEAPYPRDVSALQRGLKAMPAAMAAMHAGTAAVARWLSTLVCADDDDVGIFGDDRDGGDSDRSRTASAAAVSPPPWAAAPLRAVHWAYAESSPSSPPSESAAAAAGLSDGTEAVISATAAISNGHSNGHSEGGTEETTRCNGGRAVVTRCAAASAAHFRALTTPPAAPAFPAATDAAADPVAAAGGAALTPGCVVTFELRGTWFRRPPAPGQSPHDAEAEAEAAHHERAQAVLGAFYDAVGLISPDADSPVGHTAGNGVATAARPSPVPRSPPGRQLVGVVKGPSFGASFTILTPFAYLAHYDLVRAPEGRARLYAAGLNPYLLRLSVGCEPPDAVIAALRVGFAAAAAAVAEARAGRTRGYG